MGLLDYLYGSRDTGQPLLDGSGVDSVGNPLFMDPAMSAEGKRRFLEALATMPSVEMAKDAVKAPVDAYQGKFDPLSDEGTARAMGMAGLAMTGGIAGAPKGAIGSGPARRMTEVPDLRGLPVEEALAIARKEPHLIKGGEGTEGAYVGGPRDIQSKRGLTNLRKRTDEFVAEDPRGGDWYDRFRNSINEVTGGNPIANAWMARQEGQWSAGASPESELAFALKENNSALVGEPVKAGRPASHQALLKAIEENDPTLLARGKKTGEYAYKINPDTAADATTATGVNDFRHQRLLGYTNADGSLPSSGNHMVGDTIHRFMDYETALMVDRANKANLGGRSNWTGEQIQAAPWVRQKAQSLMERNPNLSYEEAFTRANTTIGDFFGKHTAFATHEAQPGPSTGHLPGLQQADQAVKDAYALDPRSSWANAPGGRDAIYGAMQLGDTGVAARVRPTQSMQGVYEGANGLELNRGEVARPLVSFDAGKVKSVPAHDRTMLDTGESLRAYIDAQDAGAWHKPWLDGQPGQSNSLFLPAEGALPREQAAALRALGQKHGLPDLSDTGQGVTMTSFGGDLPDSKALGKLLRKGELRQEIEQAAPGLGAPHRAKVDGGYVGYTGEWAKGTGSGAATLKVLEDLNASPNLRDALNRDVNIPKNAIARMERDAEIAGKTGDTLRPDIQNARKIIGEGPGWIDRLDAALKAGAISLPVAALFLRQAQGPSEDR